MKSRGVIFCLTLVLAASALPREEAPTAELFVGWSWMPFPYYYGSPYRYGYYPYGWGPAVGLEHPLYGVREDAFACYDPWWGYTYGVRYPLKSRRLFPNPTGSGLPPLPGAAPTELRSSERKTDWDRSIEAFLGGPAAAPTNVPPSRAPVSP